MIKKTLIGMFILIGMFSCDKNDDEVTVDDDEITTVDPTVFDIDIFLASTEPQFLSNLNSGPLEWRFGNIGNSYASIQFNEYFGAAPNSPSKRLGFQLDEWNGDNFFTILTPLYDTSSEIAFDNVFGLGLKDIGDSEDDFYLSIQNNNVNYQICGSNAGYKLEILKTEEFEVETFGESGSIISTYIRVWMKIQNINLNDCDIASDENLTGSLVLAHFNGFRTE